MAKLTDFQNPVTGQKGNLFDLGGLWQMILGVFVFFFIWAMGQNVSRAVSSRVPALDTRVEKPWTDPVPTSTNAGPRII